MTLNDCIDLVLESRARNEAAQGWTREFVYFIGAGNAVKIGFTSATPEERLAALQRHHFLTLRLEAVFDGDRRLEAGLHAMFATRRIRGEWFRQHRSIREFAEELTLATFGNAKGQAV